MVDPQHSSDVNTQILTLLYNLCSHALLDFICTLVKQKISNLKPNSSKSQKRGIKASLYAASGVFRFLKK